MKDDDESSSKCKTVNVRGMTVTEPEDISHNSTPPHGELGNLEAHTCIPQMPTAR